MAAATEPRKYSARNTEMSCLMLPIEQLGPGANPRRNLSTESEKFAELVRSVSEQGVLEPLLVRPSACLEPGPPYEIIAGERRYRAAQMVGLIEVPVRILPFDDQMALQIALIENLIREDIDPIDEARGYKQLMDMGMKQTEIAAKVGRSQPAIANSLRLLKLPEPVLEDISAGRMSPSHGEALIPFTDYPELLEAQRQKALHGETCKAVSNPAYWHLSGTSESPVRRLMNPWPECKHCNHKRRDYDDTFCLKPECFDEKKSAVDAKLIEKAKQQAGVDDESKLLKLSEMRYSEYERLDNNVPPGCKEDCDQRVVALDRELRPVAVCLGIKCHKRLKMVETKAKKKTTRESAAGAKEQLCECLDIRGMEKATFKTILNRAAALLVSQSVARVHAPVLRAAVERLKSQGVDLDADNLRGYAYGDDPCKRLKQLSELGYHRLLLLGAELELAQDIKRAVEYSDTWKCPPELDWFLSDLCDICDVTSEPAEEVDESTEADDESVHSEPQACSHGCQAFQGDRPMIVNPECPIHGAPANWGNKSEKEPTVEQILCEPINYRDDQDRVYFVGQGIGANEDSPWFTLRRNSHDHDNKSSSRVKSKNLPNQSTRELAQWNLDTYAKAHGLKRADQ